MNTFDKAAKAAFENLARQNEEAGEPMWIGDGKALARAVLMSVRSPGDRILRAGGLGETLSRSAALAVWQDMVDEIINEEAK